MAASRPDGGALALVQEFRPLQLFGLSKTKCPQGSVPKLFPDRRSGTKRCSRQSLGSAFMMRGGGVSRQGFEPWTLGLKDSWHVCCSVPQRTIIEQYVHAQEGCFVSGVPMSAVPWSLVR